MADYTNTLDGMGAQIPDGAVETSWDDAGPLVTPREVRSLHLFGIPLVSAIKNPYTGKPDVVDDPLMEQFITQSVSLIELEAGFEIFPRSHQEKLPYDQPAQNSFGYMTLRQRPISSIQKLCISSTDGVNIWDVPLAWIEKANLHQGQINIVPFALSSTAGTTIPVTSSGLGLMPSLFRFNWVPALWLCNYTTGFKEGRIPMAVNQLIGVVAAMEILSMLATTYSRSSSSSLGIDGLSQSVSTPGPELFNVRLVSLAEKRKWLISKLKRQFGLGMFSSNV